MKHTRQNLCLFSAIILTFCLSAACPAWVFDVNDSCTWGIADSDTQIAVGSIPTDAILTLHNVSIDSSVSNRVLNIYLLDNPDEGLVYVAAGCLSDPFEGHGILLKTFSELSSDSANLIIDLSEVNDSQSSIWSCFSNPYIQTMGNLDTVNYSSALLELMDYAGSGRSFGFGFYSHGFACSGITLQMTVQSYIDSTSSQIIEYRYGNIYAPQFDPIPDYAIPCGQTLSFSVTAIDNDGDSALLYSAGNLPDGASFSGRTFTWTPTDAQEGIWSVTFNVSDGTLSDSQPVAITVLFQNHSPVLDLIEDIQIRQGEFLSLRVSASDADNDPLTFSKVSGPDWLSVSPDGLLSGTPTAGDVGTASLAIQVADDTGGIDTAAISITVEAAPAAWTLLLYDDFESGFGNWIDGGSNCLRYYGSLYAYQGVAALNLRSNTRTSITTTTNLALSAYSQIKVEFSYLCISMDSSKEDFWLQISTNGGASYSTVEEWNLNDEFVNGQYYHETVIISGYTLTNKTKLRFRCDASAINDKVYIDTISVSVQ